MARIPMRLWTAFLILTAPLRAIVMILDALVAAAVLGCILVGYLWWTERISDDQVAHVLGIIGQRGLDILQKAGVHI